MLSTATGQSLVINAPQHTEGIDDRSPHLYVIWIIKIFLGQLTVNTKVCGDVVIPPAQPSGQNHVSKCNGQLVMKLTENIDLYVFGPSYSCSNRNADF